MSDLAHRYRVEFINGQHMVIRANSPKDAMTYCGLWYGLRAVSAELLKDEKDEKIEVGAA
jgi:hypothetical protein